MRSLARLRGNDDDAQGCCGCLIILAIGFGVYRANKDSSPTPPQRASAAKVAKPKKPPKPPAGAAHPVLTTVYTDADLDAKIKGIDYARYADDRQEDIRRAVGFYGKTKSAPKGKEHLNNKAALLWLLGEEEAAKKVMTALRTAWPKVKDDPGYRLNEKLMTGNNSRKFRKLMRSNIVAAQQAYNDPRASESTLDRHTRDAKLPKRLRAKLYVRLGIKRMQRSRVSIERQGKNRYGKRTLRELREGKGVLVAFQKASELDRGAVGKAAAENLARVNAWYAKLVARRRR